MYCFVPPRACLFHQIPSTRSYVAPFGITYPKRSTRQHFHPSHFPQHTSCHKNDPVDRRIPTSSWSYSSLPRNFRPTKSGQWKRSNRNISLISPMLFLTLIPMHRPLPTIPLLPFVISPTSYPHPRCNSGPRMTNPQRR